MPSGYHESQDKKWEIGISLVVQWPRFCAPNAGGPGSIPGQGTRSHVLQLKITHSATKTWSSQINIKKKKKKEVGDRNQNEEERFRRPPGKSLQVKCRLVSTGKWFRQAISS